MSDKEPQGIIIASGIFPPDIGGPATYAQNIASALHKKGIPVCVVTYSKAFKVAGDKNSPFKIIRVWGGWPIWIKHAIFGINLLIHAPKYKTVFALNMWSAGFPARIVARLFKKRFIVRVVGDYAWELAVGRGKTSFLLDDFQKHSKSGWIKMLYRIQTLICRGAHQIVVPSEYLAGVVEGWGVAKEKISVIYNGVEFIPSKLTKEEARKKLGITGNVLFSWGRLVPWKGFRMLIKIMPRLTEINSFFKLIIVGDGPDRALLEKMIRNMGLERKVLLPGRKSQSEVADYLAASDIFILNSGYEGFSHQILEAMTAGVPSIVSSSGGNKEIIHQGENGFMVKYNDEFNIIEAVRTLWNNPETREHFIQEGKNTVQHFSADKMFKETVSLLTQ